LRQFNGIIAGAGKMKWKKFIFYNIIGAVLWSASWSGMAYLTGEHARDIVSVFKRFEYFYLAGLFLSLAIFIVYKFTKKRFISFL